MVQNELTNYEQLRKVAPLLRRISSGQNLTVEEAREALNTIGTHDEEGFYFLALTFGVMAKRPTPAELEGFCLSLRDNTMMLQPNVDPAKVADISGTGGDRIKTFNVGTSAGFVAAAGGAIVAKQSTRAYTGVTGSADVFRELGVDVFSVTPEKVTNALEQVGIAGFYSPAFSPNFANRMKFLRKISTMGLTYTTPWHLVSWIVSPIPMHNRLYGMFTDQYLHAVAELFIKLGYRRGMVVHGVDGLDEFSNIGPTKVCEFREGKTNEFTVTPEDAGLSRASAEEIQAFSPEGNLSDFFKVLYGRGQGAKRDLVALNAGALLYIAQIVPTLREGVSLALDLIQSGKAAQKLEEYISLAGDTEKLKSWKARLDL